MTQHPELDYSPAGIARVQAELASVPKDTMANTTATLENISSYDARTRLVMLLYAQSGRSQIADPAVYQTLREEFWRCINTFIGGITRDAYRRYAAECDVVKEAALYHRKNFQPKASPVQTKVPGEPQST